MGVMPCSRVGCKNILCTRYNDAYGYICTECFEKLVESGTLDVAAFMDTMEELVHKPGESFYEEIFPLGEF